VQNLLVVTPTRLAGFLHNDVGYFAKVDRHCWFPSS